MLGVDLDHRARAEQIAKQVAALTVPADAANLSYELGELYERRLGDEERALKAYRDAFTLDPSLRPNLWALRRVLYRRALWPDVVKVLDVELGHAATGDERVEWLVERAIVSGHHGSSDDQARAALDAALAISPQHQGALLELERVVAKLRDLPATIGVWEQLAIAIDQPERKIAYWLEVSRHSAAADYDRACRALDAATELATRLGPVAVRVARERLRIADAHGTPAHVASAIEALIAVLSGSGSAAIPREVARRRELVALRRRQAQLVRRDSPNDAWRFLEQALANAAEEPVVLVDLIELAGEIDRHGDLAPLVQTWEAAESEANRATMLSYWSASAHVPERREQLRTLLRSVERCVPGFIASTAIAECDALSDPARVRAQLDLATTYVAAGQAASQGTWLGPWSAVQPDVGAAAAFYVQAGYLLTHYVGTPAALDQARDALGRALEVVPEHPAAIEALIELDESAGRTEAALARLRDLANVPGTKPAMRAHLERAIRFAYSHDLPESVVELQRDLVALAPTDFAVAWQLEASLSQVNHAGERAELLAMLSRKDSDPLRRRTALFDAARLHERAGAVQAASDLYRQLLAVSQDDRFARDALIGLYRSQQRWADLVKERRAEIRLLTDEPSLRRALRETAWVLEIWLHDVSQAVAVYDQWLARMPNDRTALEGVARCRAQLRDHGGEVVARAKIAEIDQTPDARWLHARSLERAGRYDQAAQQYRSLVGNEESPVAAASATLALGDLAARGSDIGKRVEAADALAQRTTDPRLGAALFEYSGWLNAIALDDFEHAAEAFAAALALYPERQGSLLGAALVAACKADRVRMGTAYAELARTIEMPQASVALFLRAAAIAAAAGDPGLATERIEAASAVAPDDINVLFVATEVVTSVAPDSTDPFAAVDRVLGRAELIKARGELADDPTSRAAWQLDHAEALELGGQLREAAAVVATVLHDNPENWRAVLALRRLAQRSDNKVTWAQASYALSRLSRDPAMQLRMLRDAVEVFDGGAQNNPDFALAIYRRIVALGPEGKELDRFRELLRERGDPGALIGALTERLTSLLAAPASEKHATMVGLLVERAVLLRSLGHRELAIADLDAVLEHAPKHLDALRRRADLAIETGDRDRAVALWWRYLSVETAAPARAEVELLLAQALDKAVAATAPVTPTEQLRGVNKLDELEGLGGLEDWGEATNNDMPAREPEQPPEPSRKPPGDTVPQTPKTRRTTASRSTPAIVRRTPEPVADKIASAPEPDVFGSTTVLTDLSALQEQERQEARSSAAQYEVEITVPLGTTEVSPPTLPPPLAALLHNTQTGMSVGTDLTSNTAAIAAALGASVKMDIPAPSRKLRPPELDLAQFRTAATSDLEPKLDARAMEFPEQRPMSPDDSAVVMLSYDQLQPVKSDEADDELLAQFEREIAAALDPATAAALRVEAGRLSEAIADADRARAHYEAALVANPRLAAALRGLRRIARNQGDLAEVTRLVDAELAIAGVREKSALQRYRIDLLMATGEQDVARVAVGELLDSSPLDLQALLAHLELAFLDDRSEAFGKALEMLTRAVTEPSLCGALQAARAVLAAHRGDHATAASWFAAAAEADPDSPATRLGAIRHAAAQGQGEAAGVALYDLACHVESEDPITAAALAVRAQLWTASAISTEASVGRETIAGAAQLASGAAPRDPLVARIATESALLAGDPTIISHAFARWARCKGAPVERAYAAARAAELDPARLGRLWAQVLELDPGDDYATARLRAVHVAAGETSQAIDLDVQAGHELQRDASLVRAASDLVTEGHLDVAVNVLSRAREQRPRSAALGEALAEVLARAGRWLDRAKLLAEVATEPGQLARDVARLRSAFAWERAAREPGASEPARIEGEASAREQLIVGALDAWDLVLQDTPGSAVAHAAAIGLASQLDTFGLLLDVLARAQAVESSPWAASSLALRRARLLMRGDARLAQDVARDGAPGVDDPRRTLVVMMAAAQRRELGEAATALEDRAKQLEAVRIAGKPAAPTAEPATLRFRAAHLALDADDVPRATALLVRIGPALPVVAADLLDVARLRAGGSMTTRPRGQGDSFVRILRDADLATERGDQTAALELYQRALELRTTDPLAGAPMIRIATALKDPIPIATLALEQLRTAEAFGDTIAKAEGYELLAHADKVLRGDATAAQIALESASQADPTRIDLLHRLEHELAAAGRYADLLQLREREIELIKRALAGGLSLPERDLVAMIMDAATLASRSQRPDARLGELYRGALAIDPTIMRALFHLESIMRRAGFTEDVAALEERIAASFTDPRSQAAFLTRAGETLAAIGKPLEAVQRFALAADTLPSYQPALAAWHDTALRNALWFELAEATTRQARRAIEPKPSAALHHFAGVALMDKAVANEPAIGSLRSALEADPEHVDAFLRLRMLYETTGNHGELAALLSRRLEVEPDRAAQVELHSTLAEHWRTVGDRDRAMQHYRAMLSLDPTLARAHAAIADVASEHGTWQAVAAAVNARVPLETDPKILASLHHRLGMLYAEHDVPHAMSSFQRALTYRPGELDTLVRLTDLAIGAGEWKIALDACNELVTSERDPEKLALNLHRAAIVFAAGFGDRERAERMLQLAVDSAPTSSDSLRLLVKFYNESGDTLALRAHLDRVVAAMRLRVAHDAKDGPAYRTLARAVSARITGPTDPSASIARAAAELAVLLGAGEEPEGHLLAAAPRHVPSLLVGPRADELLFLHAIQPQFRHIFRAAGSAIVKHVGADVGAYGVGRKDRLHQTDPAAAIIRDLGMTLGFKEVDVYVSTRHPYVMAAEPTNPVSLVLGSAIAAGDTAGIVFAAGAALKLAQLSLAIPARLPLDELGVLGLALVRLVQPAIASASVDMEAVAASAPKLKRLVSSAALEELRSHATSVTSFNPQAFARDLKIAGLRAGMAASGSVLPVGILAASVGTDLPSVLGDPVVQGLISFALADDRLTDAQ